MKANNNIDDVVEFNEGEHKYKHNGHQFEVSVTEFVHKHFPEFIEEEVINNILGSMKMNNPSYEYYGMNRQQILDYWELGKNLGTFLHAQIERYYINLKQGIVEPVDESKISIEYRYFLNFARDFYYINPYRTELRIYSKDLDLAGSIDLLVKNPDGTYFIFDRKRAKNINTSTTPDRYTTYGLLPGISHIMSTNLNHYRFQLNVYRYILQREYGIVVAGMALAIFHPNNKSKNYEIHSVPFMDREMEYIMNIRLQNVRNRPKMNEI